MNSQQFSGETLRAVVVEDEALSLESIRVLLQSHEHALRVVGIARSAEEAVAAIRAHRPDLVFLDVELPDGTGFDVLANTCDVEYRVIFTTAHNEYAVRAIRFAALDYLLKPIDADELAAAVGKACAPPKLLAAAKQHSGKKGLALSAHAGGADRIAVPTLDGLLFLSLSDILWCGASSNYTELHCISGSAVTSSRTLGAFEELLEDKDFFRIHHSTLVNLAHLQRYVKGKGGYVVLSNGKELEVSSRRKDEFLERLGL